MFLLLFFILLNPNFIPNREIVSIQGSNQQSYKNISVTEAVNLIENTTMLFILDVRTIDEYLDGHINNSVLIPHNEIESKQDELPLNKSRQILVYCRTGVRSAIASNTLVTLNYTSVYNMLGGYAAWVEAINSLTNEPPFIITPEIFFFLFIPVLLLAILAGVIIILKRSRAG
ncbi:MAG: rhodanese-like domain-containing protein [Candidatus Hodarchaeota archaeon]